MGSTNIISSGHIFENPGFPPAVSYHSALWWENKSDTQAFLLRLFTNLEVFNTLSSNDPKKSAGADQLELRLLLLAAPFLVECLTYIFNFSLTESVPDFSRAAYVLLIPI